MNYVKAKYIERKGHFAGLYSCFLLRKNIFITKFYVYLKKQKKMDHFLPLCYKGPRVGNKKIGREMLPHGIVLC